MLQHGDSFFPSGSVGFSFGVETLVGDGMVRDADDVQRFLVEQIQFRWASAERAVLSAAWRCGVDLQALKLVDAVQEAMTLSRELREGSRRTGAALLSVHRSLNTTGAAEFSAMIAAGDSPGHLSVVQGLVWRGSNLGLAQCQLLSAHTFCVGVLGAALRLSVIGHLAAQKILVALHPLIDSMLNTPTPPLELANAYSPLAEIATMRHQDQTTRLFSN